MLSLLNFVAYFNLFVDIVNLLNILKKYTFFMKLLLENCFF